MIRAAFFQLFFAFALSSSFAFAEDPLRVSLLDKTGTLTWTGITPGSLYAVESAPSIESTNWSTVFYNLEPTTNSMTVTVPVTNVIRFYRVVQRGSCCQNDGGISLASAVSLGSVCGDSSPFSINRTGCGNAWYRLRATECNTSIFSIVDLKVNFTLSSPSGSDYDLYAYYSDGTIRGSSQNRGTTTDTVQIIQTDTQADDAFDVFIEIRRVAGFDCISWNFTVQNAN